ncbi:hypothetical protein GCM10023108_33530 [Saccharopolyspora hordei]
MVEVPFFHDVKPVRRVRDEVMDVHHPDGPGPHPAVVFVHGGPVPEDAVPTPRDWEGFLGHGALVAASGLVGITFNHRLHTDQHYPEAADDVAAVIERTRELEEVDADRIALWCFSGGAPSPRPTCAPRRAGCAPSGSPTRCSPRRRTGPGTSRASTPSRRCPSTPSCRS